MEIILANHNREFARIAIVMLVLASLGTLGGGQIQAQSSPQSLQPASSKVTVIQGRITAVNGNRVTLKTPDQYPGGPGIHAQVVVAGPTVRVDISQARLLLADGKQPDKSPLAVGDRVVMVLNGLPAEGPIPLNAPRRRPPTYSALIVERIVQSDRITTH